MLIQNQDITQTTIQGLESSSYKDKVKSNQVAATNQHIAFTEETDRIYSIESAEAPITILEAGHPAFEVTRDGLSDVVVWNPWAEKAKGMSDFGPTDGWKHMVCVEAGSVGTWNKLEGGDVWEGGQKIKTV